MQAGDKIGNCPFVLRLLIVLSGVLINHTHTNNIAISQ